MGGGGIAMSQPSCYPECRHILPSGSKCHAPALRGKALCYHHYRTRDLVEANRARKRSVALPPLEDRASIQMALNQVFSALAASKIDVRLAGLYFYGINIAAQNLTRAEQFPSPDPVELTIEPSGDILAAPATLAETTAEPAAEPVSGPVPEAPARPEPALQPDLEQDSGHGLEQPNPHGTHEYDPEPPPPLSGKERRQRIRGYEASLSNARAAHTYWVNQRAREVKEGQDPPPADIVVAHIDQEIEKIESGLKSLREQETPDPDTQESAY